MFGAIINVAVAWSCAMFAADVPIVAADHGSPVERSDALQTWAAGQKDVLVVYARGIGVANQLCLSSPAEIGDQVDVNCLLYSIRQTSEFINPWGLELPGAVITPCKLELRAGWPARSLRCECFMIDQRVLPSRDQLSVIRVVNGQSQKRSLPLRPIWPAFAINTLAYAAILWLVFIAPFKVRRAIRRRRGCCGSCNYPVGPSDICTECGKPVGHHARNQAAIRPHDSCAPDPGGVADCSHG